MLLKQIRGTKTVLAQIELPLSWAEVTPKPSK